MTGQRASFRRSGGFTLVELLVVIGVALLLIGLLIPVVSHARQVAGQARCANNLRQWATAVQAYAVRNEDCLPRRGQGKMPTQTLYWYDDWFNELPPFLGQQTYQNLVLSGQMPQIGDGSVWICPQLSGNPNVYGNLFGYAMNMALSVRSAPLPDRITAVGQTSTLVFMADGPAGYSSTVPFVSTADAPAPFNPVPRHNGQVNLAFLDGHVAAYPANYLGVNTEGDPVHPDACNQPDVRWYWYVPGPSPRSGPVPEEGFSRRATLSRGVSPRSGGRPGNRGLANSLDSVKGRIGHMYLGVRNRLFRSLSVALAILAGVAGWARAGLLTTETFFLPPEPGNPAAAPYTDMLVNTSPSVTTWGEKGAVGLQGSSSQFYNGTSFVNEPASTVAFKFNIGAIVDTLNSTYGAGNWTVSSPALTMQYTYYANNSIFGGGAGSFETYYVANNNWAFGNGAAAGNSYGSSTYVAGTDAVYATSPATLLTWSGSQADLGSTTYNWLSPSNNPNYAGWSTAKTGPNQGLLTDNLNADPMLVGAITSASAAGNPNVSLYLMPNSSAVGLTIFTGGGNETPELSFNVVSVPEPASIGLAALLGATMLLCRGRRI